MAATKTYHPLFTTEVLTAGGADVTSQVIAMATGLGGTLAIKLLNGATGPTLPAQVQIQVANDTSQTLLADYGGPFIGNTDNNGEESWGGIIIDKGIQSLQVIAGSNTGQNVTVDADFSQVTDI